MSKAELIKLGIIIGHTVTKALIKKAKTGKLPDAAMSELWQGRTLNKKAMRAIEKAITGNKKKVGDK